MKPSTSLLQKSVITLLLGWALFATVLRSWRTPNDFAEAHWLLTYEFGFIKRGLPGQVLSWFSDAFTLPVTEGLIAGVSLLFSALCLLGLLAIAWRMVQRSHYSANIILICLVFLCSPFIVIMSHVNGYYDHIVIFLGLISLALVHKGKLLTAALVCCISMLIHENTLLLTYPALCLGRYLACHAGKSQKPYRIHSHWPLLLPPMTFLLILLATVQIDAHLFQTLYTTQLSAYSFIQADRNTLVPEWILGGIHNSSTPHMGEALLHLGSLMTQQLITPSVIVIVLSAIVCYHAPDHRFGILGLLALCLLPQLMHLAAWDTNRIWTYSIFTSFLALWSFSELRPARDNAVELGGLFSLILFINIATITPLMDGEYDQLYDIDKRLTFFGPVMLFALSLVLFPQYITPRNTHNNSSPST